MTHDRDFYRSLSHRSLLLVAEEEGINPEMAIALAEALAEAYDPARCRRGHFHFRKETACTN